MRDSEALSFAEGFMTTEESTSMRSTAFADLNTACNCDSSKFEASLLGFYSKWVDSEIAELSRAIELVQRKRTLEQLTTDYAATHAELVPAQNQEPLLTLLPVQPLPRLAS